MLERVDAGRVSVAPVEADRIAAYRVDRERTDILADRFLAKPLVPCDLVDADRAPTAHAQGIAGVDALVPVLPEHPHLVLGWPRNLRDLRSIGGDSTDGERADLRREILGDPKEGAGARRLGHRLDDRVSLVRGRADRRRQRDLTQEGDPVQRRESPGAAAAEDLLTVAA